MGLFEYIIYFVLGAAVGSFLNVLGSRYSDKSGFKKAFSGRSYCDHCKKGLKWYELIPLISFLVQRGRCRSCKKQIPWQYFLVELAAGLIAILVPLKIGLTFFTIIWVLVMWILLLMSIIDLRFKVIPDALVILIASLGIINIVYRYISGPWGKLSTTKGVDLIGHYSLLLKFGMNPLINHLVAVGVGLLLFGGIYLITRGRGMGLGDVKLVSAFGFLIMWPDIILVLIMPFLIGSAVGFPLILQKKVKLKSSIPFGPFIACGVLLTFFFGYDIVNAYFQLFGLI